MLETTTVSILFIEDEARTRNFLPENASPASVARTAMSLFKKKFGKVFAMIRPLPDFALFRIIPSGGLYVRGFGQAFEVSAVPRGERLLAILCAAGHRDMSAYGTKADMPGLRHELTAINQYWLHYRPLNNWGCKPLAK